MESENQVSRDNNMGQNMDLVTSRSGQLTDPSSTDRSAKSWNCCKLKLPSLRALITLTACFMLELAVGVSYTMGNMMPYVTSYLRNVTRETSLDYSTALWAGNTSWIVNSISMMFLGLLEHCMPYKVFLMLGIFFFAGSLIGSYWAVQTSFVAYVIVYGPFQGLAQGILWPSGIKVALKWFPERKRFIGALIMAGYGAGAFGWNQMVTQWINPDNLQPDLTVGEDVYFSQPEVLSNVPSCYLLLGGVLSGIQLLCILSFTFPPPSHTDTQEKSTRILVAVEEEAIKTSDPPSLDDVRSPTGGDDHSDKNGDMSVSDVDPEKSDSATSTPDYRPLQVLKSRMTWTLWLIKMSTGLGFVFIWDFYKTYGQTFIHDDHFLALTGSFASVFNTVWRPLAGLMAEKIGFQACLIVGLSVLTVTTSTFILCEFVGKAMYFAWVCIMYSAMSIYYAAASPLIFAVFGPRYFSFSIGVVETAGIIYEVMAIFVASGIKEVFGWHGIYLLTGACQFVGLLLAVSLWFDCGHPLPANMKRELFSRKHREKEQKAVAEMH